MDPGSFSAWTGAGTLNLSITASNGFGGGTALGSFLILGSGNYSATGTVTYGYDAATPSVPEPATMGLIGSALIGLVALRKRFAR